MLARRRPPSPVDSSYEPGAYTTFSTFAFESYELCELRHVALGAAYIGTSIAAGIAAIALGQRLGRAI